MGLCASSQWTTYACVCMHMHGAIGASIRVWPSRCSSACACGRNVLGTRRLMHTRAMHMRIMPMRAMHMRIMPMRAMHMRIMHTRIMHVRMWTTSICSRLARARR